MHPPTCTHIHNCMLLGGLDDLDPAQWDDADVHAIFVDPQFQEAEHVVDLIESTSDSGASEDQRPSPEVENRHVSGTGSMGREDSVSGAAEKASTEDTGGPKGKGVKESALNPRDKHVAGDVESALTIAVQMEVGRRRGLGDRFSTTSH